MARWISPRERALRRRAVNLYRAELEYAYTAVQDACDTCGHTSAQHQPHRTGLRVCTVNDCACGDYVPNRVEV
jgi:hypothetical protein